MTTTTRTVTLNGTACTVTAAVSGTSAEILSVTDPSGKNVHTTSDDLDVIEQALSEETAVDAYDFTAGHLQTFRVRHLAGTVLAIYNAGGYRLPSHSEQFTEAAEAFHVDRHWAMIEESDVQGYARHAYGW